MVRRYISYVLKIYILCAEDIYILSSTSTCVYQRSFIFFNTKLHIRQHEATYSSARIYICANTYIHLRQHVYTSAPTRIYIFVNTYIHLRQHVYTLILPGIGIPYLVIKRL